MPERDQLLDDLETGLTYADFEDEYDMSRDAARSKIQELQSEGVPIEETTVDQYGTKMYKMTEEVDDEFRWIKEDGEYRFAVISDTHLGSEGEQLESLEKMYDRIEDEDIDVVFHAGDISDGTVKNNGRGVYRGHSNHLKPEAIGWDRLLDYVTENYPERDGVDTFFISGNHDHQLFKNTGIRFGEQLDDRRDDLHFIGDSYANVDLGEIDMDLVHPSGGAPYCYSGDTRVLTRKHGFVRFDQVASLVAREGDIEVATFDIDSGSMEFQKPEKLVVMDADEMIQFEGQGVDQFVTANHRMIVRKNGSYHGQQGDWEIRKASEVKDDYVRQKFDIPRAAEWSAERLEEFELGAEHFNGKDFSADGDDFLRFLGWFIAEGWVKDNEKGRIHLSQTEEKEDVAEVVRAVGLNGNVRKDKIKSTNRVLAEWLREEVGSGAENKRVPTEMKNLPPEQLETLLEAMFAGDGRTDSEGRMTHYSTASRKLAEDVVELLAKTGRSGTIKKRERDFEINSYKGETTVYQVSVGNSKRGKAPSLCKEPKLIEDYDGKVYCFSVPNETLFTMRNGRTAFSGNTLGYRAQTWLRDKPDEEKADITVFGHLHQFLNAETEGSQVLYAGAWQGSTPFLERKGIKPKAGGWLLDLEVDDGDIRSFQTDRVMFPLKNDGSDVSADDINDMLSGE